MIGSQIQTYVTCQGNNKVTILHSDSLPWGKGQDWDSEDQRDQRDRSNDTSNDSVLKLVDRFIFKVVAPQLAFVLQVSLCMHQILPNTALKTVGAVVLIFRAPQSVMPVVLSQGHPEDTLLREYFRSEEKMPFPNLQKGTLHLVSSFFNVIPKEQCLFLFHIQGSVRCQGHASVCVCVFYIFLIYHILL